MFNVSISSFLYQRLFGEYIWYDYNDYKGILNFFINGQFFIPFLIFTIVYAFTEGLSIVSFALLNHLFIAKYQAKIMIYQYKKDNVDKGLSVISSSTKLVLPLNITPGIILNVYKNKIKP